MDIGLFSANRSKLLDVLMGYKTNTIKCYQGEEDLPRTCWVFINLSKHHASTGKFDGCLYSTQQCLKGLGWEGIKGLKQHFSHIHCTWDNLS